jgi:hypothetical protein
VRAASPLRVSSLRCGPRPDDHPAAALWWRILDELPPKAEPGPSNPQGRRSDPGTTHHVLRAAGTPAAVGAASRVPPEPLKLDFPTHHHGWKYFDDLLTNHLETSGLTYLLT